MRSGSGGGSPDPLVSPNAPLTPDRFDGGAGEWKTVRQLSDLMEIFRLLASAAFGIWMCRIPSLN